MVIFLSYSEGKPIFIHGFLLSLDFQTQHTHFQIAFFELLHQQIDFVNQ